jgi:hypothetical protein
VYERSSSAPMIGRKTPQTTTSVVTVRFADVERR